MQTSSLLNEEAEQSGLARPVEPIKAMSSPNDAQPTVVIKPSSGWAAPNLREIWEYRDLLFILASRDVKLRYKQTALGIIWVILQPLTAAIIFTVIFSVFAHIKSQGPYLLSALCGLLPWTYFAGSLQRAGNSLITDSRLISKVYFPRLLIPLASTAAVLIDFAVTLGVVLVCMAAYHVAPTWRIAAMPFFLLVTTLTAVGISLWLSALNIKYRDFMYAVPFLIQIWMYASLVVVPMSVVPVKYHLLFSLNPAVGFVEGFRWAFLGSQTLTVEMVLLSTCTSILAFISGIFYFRRVERQFADFI